MSNSPWLCNILSQSRPCLKSKQRRVFQNYVCCCRRTERERERASFSRAKEKQLSSIERSHLKKHFVHHCYFKADESGSARRCSWNPFFLPLCCVLYCKRRNMSRRQNTAQSVKNYKKSCGKVNQEFNPIMN